MSYEVHPASNYSAMAKAVWEKPAKCFELLVQTYHGMDKMDESKQLHAAKSAWNIYPGG